MNIRTRLSLALHHVRLGRDREITVRNAAHGGVADVTYVCDRGGVSRIVTGPDGQRYSERRMPVAS